MASYRMILYHRIYIGHDIIWQYMWYIDLAIYIVHLGRDSAFIAQATEKRGNVKRILDKYMWYTYRHLFIYIYIHLAAYIIHLGRDSAFIAQVTENRGNVKRILDKYMWYIYIYLSERWDMG